MTVYRSQDGGRTWPGFTVVAQGGASYSCMSQLPSDPTRVALLCTPDLQTPAALLPLSSARMCTRGLRADERDGPLCTAVNDTQHPTVACNIVFTTFPADF